jgi:hypothetical protein
MPDLKEFEAALIKRLGTIDMDKSFLKTASSAIVNLKKQGLVVDRVYWKGTPRPDRFIINGKVDPDFWGKFRDLGFNFKRFEVFPYGIVNPEGFNFKGTIGM